MKRSQPWPWGWIICGVLILFFVGGVGLLMIGATLAGSATAGPRVGLISIDGPIMDSPSRGVLGGSAGGTRDFIENLQKAEKDPNIKAVVVRVNSPGGSPAASQEMFQAIRRLRTKKPVYCSMADMAASGGYYIAAGCEKIYANPSTLTGSIGVISQFLNYSDLFKKVGLDEATIKSGKFKDAGNPSRPLTPAERQLFQSMIMNVYNQFVNDIVIGRKDATKGKLTRAKVLQLADGRVYTGQQAQANGLVDELGGLHETVQAAGKAGGIEGDPKIVEIGSGGLFGGLMGTESSSGIANDVAHEMGRAFGAAFAKGMVEQMKVQSTNTVPQLR
jgi:protease-4